MIRLDGISCVQVGDKSPIVNCLTKQMILVVHVPSNEHLYHICAPIIFSVEPFHRKVHGIGKQNGAVQCVYIHRSPLGRRSGFEESPPGQPFPEEPLGKAPLLPFFWLLFTRVLVKAICQSRLWTMANEYPLQSRMYTGLSDTNTVLEARPGYMPVSMWPDKSVERNVLRLRLRRKEEKRRPPPSMYHPWGKQKE
ncbi:hypothetical protein CEXT_241511 [Caerostris extrusa]|uniref:Uncharacterized protein n=1 Tax=Caerostris extrusa TaxID=172846 RepID=A0AAV4TMJ3_CAEEX|nr:hypothetical protein CEXT_241511 [Caerostris extrusa]